jgi:GntR family transcriptional regulator
MVTEKQRKAAAAKAVGKNLPVPLYHQIFLLLRDEIISGQRPHGSLVPTEQELSRIYGVSRITTRRALDELAQDRLVERKRRVGTRVIYQPASPPFEASLEQGLESLLTLGRTTKAKLMEYADEVGEPSVLAMLHLEPHEHVVRVVRVRWLDNQPLGCIVSYMPAKLGLKFSRADLETYPMLKLIERTKLKIVTAMQTISATSADAALASMLNVEIRSPILRVGRVLSSESGQPLLYTMAQYRPDRYQIRLDLHSFGDNRQSGEDGVKAPSQSLISPKPAMGTPAAKPAKTAKPASISGVATGALADAVKAKPAPQRISQD